MVDKNILLLGLIQIWGENPQAFQITSFYIAYINIWWTLIIPERFYIYFSFQ